ncbi:MAG: L-ribulose-5-phosphate 4-epimerase [Mycoplasmataceae bacterium]|nr:MAG: L-ribulose-5-phosphate 4-epimerase [Mycoplasmataceae bacterium]
METKKIFKLDITLNKDQAKLLNWLSGYTNMTIQDLLNDVVNGKRTWEDYKAINDMYEIKTNPILAELFDSEGIEQFLKPGILSN